MKNIFCLFFIIFSSISFSQTKLYCTKQGDDVLLQWEGGTPNYVITYSVTSTFQSGNVTLNSSNPGTTETHLQALKTNLNYYYESLAQERRARQFNVADTFLLHFLTWKKFTDLIQIPLPAL